jgi:hypothetical protein
MKSYSEFKLEIKTQQLNSSESYEYFMKSTEKYSSFFVLVAQTSKEVQAKKAGGKLFLFKNNSRNVLKIVSTVLANLHNKI